jgi:hypothetical protein
METAPDPRLVARYMLQYMKEDENLIKYQLESKKELDILKNDLLGLEYSKEHSKYVRSPNKDALLNEKGADTILTFLRMRISRVVSLSDLDDEEIYKRSLYFLNDLTFLLVRHMEEYDVKSLQIVQSILGLCDDVFFSTLKKARNAGERDSLRKNFSFVESSESVTQTQKKPGGGFFANPFANRGG